jgi:SPP1 family predicted phage head-tail adaptor
LKIGKLRHRITIEQKAKVSDGAGGYTESWVPFVTIWASVDPVSGKEYYEAQQMQSSVSHKIRIRYKSGVLPSMRVNFKERIFAVESVINWEERNRDMMLMCTEVTPVAN